MVERLKSMSEAKYAEFQARLMPHIDKKTIIGVRAPKIKQLCREIKNTAEAEKFLSELPHKYYDENMLHSALLCEIKDFDTAISRVNEFLPYVDNWAVCDTVSPKAFAKHKNELIGHIKGWINSKEEYTCRFGIEMLMSFYLDDDFRPEYLEWVSAVKGEEYYVKMMVAWFFATALAKQWDAAVPYIEKRLLPEWTHKKTITKAIESYRITDEQKAYLKTFR